MIKASASFDLILQDPLEIAESFHRPEVCPDEEYDLCLDQLFRRRLVDPMCATELVLPGSRQRSTPRKSRWKGRDLHSPTASSTSVPISSPRSCVFTTGLGPRQWQGYSWRDAKSVWLWWCLDLIADCRYVIALIAVLKTGAAYCPIKLASPGPLLSFVFDEVQPCVTITKREWADKIPHGLDQFMLDDGWIDDVGGPLSFVLARFTCCACARYGPACA